MKYVRPFEAVVDADEEILILDNSGKLVVKFPRGEDLGTDFERAGVIAAADIDEQFDIDL